jgi:hypothetical protein
VTVAIKPNAVLLRYAPDSVKFSDAKLSTFDQIKVRDQIRALGIKNDAGSQFTAEKLVSVTFRNLGVTIVSLDSKNHTIGVRDLGSGQSMLVRTNADSKLHHLPPAAARALAELNSAGAPRGKAGSKPGAEPFDAQQMLERAPALDFTELKPGDPLIVVSTEGAKTSEVKAIEILADVQLILAARPKGSDQVVWVRGA